MSKKQRAFKAVPAKPTSRSVAVSVVHTVRFGQDAVQAALDAAYSRLPLPLEERAFCTELVYGSLRKFYRLEFFLRGFLERFDGLPKEMGTALCVASYELFYTRVPVYATVDSFVSLIHAQFGPVMGKVANGVLRNLDRNRDYFEDKDRYLKRSASPLAASASWHGVPLWLLEAWQKTYGEESAQRYLAASSVAPPNALRFNARVAGAKDAFYALYPFSLEATASHVVLQAAVQVEGQTAVQVEGQTEVQTEVQAGGQAAVQAEVQPNVSPVVPPAVSSDIWSLFSGPPHLSFAGPLPSRAHEFMEKGLASQQSGAVLDVLAAMRPHEWQGPVWDCCCGRGGKTLALLEQGVEVVLASDISKPRLRGLQHELARLGLHDGASGDASASVPGNVPGNKHGNMSSEISSNGTSEILGGLANRLPEKLPKQLHGRGGGAVCHVEHFSATRDIRESQFYANTGRATFGAILIDAPCSGFGTLARHPEIRFRRTREDVAKLAALQSAILDNAVRHLISGGDLIYITCTLMPEENEEQSARFLERHSEMRLVESYQTAANSVYGEFFYGVRFTKN